MARQGKMTLVLAKLSVTTTMFAPSPQQALSYLLQELQGGTRQLNRGRSTWILANLVVEGSVIFGTLYKAKTKDFPVITPAGLARTTIENLAEEWSHWALDTSTERMVFEDRTPRISPTSFCATVGAMFTRAIEGRGAGLVTIHPLGREEELLGFLRSSKRVITAQFSVVPPNGLEGEHTWERLVAKFQELNATSHFVQWRSSDPDGLNWEHTEIEDYARYTTKGYGVASIQAETQDGHIVRYKSSDGGIRLTLECPDLDVFQEVMRVLSKALAIKEDPSSPGGA